MYKPYALPGAKGGSCCTATFQPVPVEAFFSITVYGPDRNLSERLTLEAHSAQRCRQKPLHHFKDDRTPSVYFIGHRINEFWPQLINRF